MVTVARPGARFAAGDSRGFGLEQDDCAGIERVSVRSTQCGKRY